jgi:hypothetical protein
MQKAAGSMSSDLPGPKYLGQSKQARPRYFSANRGGDTFATFSRFAARGRQ